MRFVLLGVSIVGLFFFSGCSGKQYFKPEKSYSVSQSSYGGKIIDVTRDGATLDDGHYIGKYGMSHNINLGKGFRYLSENNNYVLSANTKGILNIVAKNTKSSVRAITLHNPVVSATIHNGLVAYILNNNTFGLYQIKGNKKLFESRSERTYAIDARAASPLFVENLVVMPMLDGKLIIVDSSNTQNVKLNFALKLITKK